MDKELLLFFLDRLATRGVFPKLYDGFREIDELAKGEDELLRVIKQEVQSVISDKIPSTFGDVKLLAWERELNLDGTDLTLDERRAQLVSYLGRSRIINDAAMQAKIDEAAGAGVDLTGEVDYDKLTLTVYPPENTEGSENAERIARAVRALLPYVPQNLRVYGMEAASNNVQMAISIARESFIQSYKVARTVEEPDWNGYLYDASTDTLMRVKYNDVEETVVEVEV